MQVEYLDQQREIWQEFNNFFDQNDLDGFVTEEDDNNDALQDEEIGGWSQLDDTNKIEANPVMAGANIKPHESRAQSKDRTLSKTENSLSNSTQSMPKLGKVKV